MTEGTTKERFMDWAERAGAERDVEEHGTSADAEPLAKPTDGSAWSRPVIRRFGLERTLEMIHSAP